MEKKFLSTLQIFYYYSLNRR